MEAKVNKEKMIEMLYEGFSVAHIAREFKVTRNTIIGHKDRMTKLGLIDVEKIPLVKMRKCRRTRKEYLEDCFLNKSKKMCAPIEYNFKPLGVPVTLLDIKPNQCHFPCSDGHYCGADATKRHGYCATHHAVVYRKVKNG